MLPYGRQSIDEDDIRAVADVLQGDFLTTGPKVAEFEEAFGALTEAAHVVACSNGTAALHLAALALGLKEGDGVIVPSVTFLATVNAARYCGADVVFADVNPDTGLMESLHIEDALKRSGGLNVRAVFPVHLAGQCADLASVRRVADRHGLKIVADACHAVGGRYKERGVGACKYEDMSVFSFHPVKTIAMGEGGAITTNDAGLADKMRSLRSHGIVKSPSMPPWYYEMPEIGFNYRVSDIQCALGLSQLKKLDGFVKRREELTRLYDELLKPLAPVVLPPLRVNASGTAWHLYAVRIDFEAAGVNRAEVMAALKEKGVGSQVHYIPVHQQPYYRALYGDLELPGAQRYYERTLSLPLYPALTDDDVKFVVETLQTVLKV
ncbi:MAG: UDP-4-amino-4,6-dideoxy-N-acetyl-beta-L-altrosamine transaminase [Alphaproteobacteria bacterium]